MFSSMLKETNLLYLGATILILLDQQYVGRFWTSCEGWLSMQTCTSFGLKPAVDPTSRCKINLLPEVSPDVEARLKSAWADKSIAEACVILTGPDLKVTNGGDKVTAMTKIWRLHDTIRAASARSRFPMYEVHEVRPARSEPLMRANSISSHPKMTSGLAVSRSKKFGIECLRSGSFAPTKRPESTRPTRS